MARAKAKKTNTEAYLTMYRQMVRIRAFEDQANQLYLSGKMQGLTHMYSGQEAVAVGEGVTVPMRFRFADLPDGRRPCSNSAPFSTAWQHDRLGSEFVGATVAAWRRQRALGSEPAAAPAEHSPE